MGSDDHSRINKFKKNWGNDPGTEDQEWEMKRKGLDPSKFGNTKGERADAIHSAKDGGIIGKTANELRKARKYLDDI